MVASQSVAQIARFIGLLDLPDRRDIQVLDEEMRGQHHESRESRILCRTSMNRGDRPAVGVSDNYGSPHVSLVENLWQHVRRFVMHVGHWTGQGDRIGTTVPKA